MDEIHISPLKDRIERAVPEPPHLLNRAIDLPYAPTFYPTEAEFSDPSKFIAAIRQKAEKFGLCKIVPPKAFLPKFNLDAEEFKFRTRRQKLKGHGAAIRAELCFISNLRAYYQQTQKEFDPPTLNSQRFNLYDLQQQVKSRGGVSSMSREKWQSVGSEMGFDSGQPGFTASIRGIYDKYLRSFNEYTANSVKPKSKRGKRKVPADKAYDSDDCGVCLTSESFETLVLCEICGVGYHPRCLQPKLETIPDCEWFCPFCIRKREAGFQSEPGELRSLLEFSARADQFKREYFAELVSREGKPGTLSAEAMANLLEEELWRLVNDSFSEVEVEDGVNLDVPSHGSGFPTSELHPDNEMSRHPWNLNNFPLLPTSMFSYLKGSIPGFTVPEVSIHQCLSITCWRTNKHYAYSVTFHHWGDTRRWYGVPSGQASAFEVAFRRETSKLFEKQPDILLRSSTTLSPRDLTKHKVEVYVLDQHPGEFVITFPLAFHAGFSHGLNFSEAINFAPLDWLPYGGKYLTRMQTFKHPPTFCHEELLLHAALNTRDRSVASGLRETLEEMQAVMKDLLFRSAKITKNKVNHTDAIPKCSVCKAFCFFISLGCRCQKDRSRVTCLMHCPELCDCILSTRICYQHLSPVELEDAISRLIELASPGAQWIEKYADFVSNSNYPELGQLEAFLAEAQAQFAELPEEAAQLAKFLDACRSWKSQAKLVITASTTHALEDLTLLPPPPELLRHLQALTAQAQRLGFQCEEKASIEALGLWVSMFCSAARTLLANPNPTLAQAYEFQAQYSQLGLMVDEGERVNQLVDRLNWCQEAQEMIEGGAGMNHRVAELQACAPQPACPRVQGLLDGLAAYLLRHPLKEPSPEPQTKAPPQPTLHITFKAPQEPMDTAEPSSETQALINLAQNLLILSESEDLLARPSTAKPAGVLKQAKDIIHQYSVFKQLQEKLNEVEPWILVCLGALSNQNVSFRRTLQAHLTVIQKQSFEHSHGQGWHGCTCFSSEESNAIKCSACGVSYHADCLHINTNQGPLTCPICDLATYRPIRLNRIHVKDLNNLIAKGNKLPFIPPELTLMVDISKSLSKISCQALALAQAPSTTIPSLKDQLRLLEGLIIFMEHETKVLRSRIARLPLPTAESTPIPVKAHSATPSIPLEGEPAQGSAYDPFSIASLMGTNSKHALPPSKPHPMPSNLLRPQSVPILPAQTAAARNVAIFPRPAPRINPFSNNTAQLQQLQRARAAQKPAQLAAAQMQRSNAMALSDAFYADPHDRSFAVMHHPGRTAIPQPRITPYPGGYHPRAYIPLPHVTPGLSRQPAPGTQAQGPGITPTIVAPHLQTSSQPGPHPNFPGHPYYRH